MNQQQPQQTPPSQNQTPDHRLDELMNRIRLLEAQNTQLRQTVDFVQNKGKAPEQKVDTGFKPELEQALVSLIKRELSPFQEQVKNQVGLVYDATDEAKFRLQYSDAKFAQYIPKVEQLRREQEAMGRWIPREEALRMVYFEETGKKAAPEAPKAQPAQPKFDPYFGAYVDPATGLPIQPGQQQPQQGQQQPAQQFQQVPQVPTGEQQDWPVDGAPAWQQAPQHASPQPQFQTPTHPGQMPGATMRPGNGLNVQHPYANPFGRLPQQGVMSQSMPAHQGRQAPTNISLESSDSELEAFADKFGDIPF